MNTTMFMFPMGATPLENLCFVLQRRYKIENILVNLEVDGSRIQRNVHVIIYVLPDYIQYYRPCTGDRFFFLL